MSKVSRRRREKALKAYLNSTPEGQRRMAKEYETFQQEMKRLRREEKLF